MKIPYTVLSVNVSTNTTEKGQTQKESVRLQPAPASTVDGVKVIAGDIQIITTDPAKFGAYKIGQVVELTSA